MANHPSDRQASDGHDNRHDKRAAKEDLQHDPAEKARQGEIILRKPWQRMVFLGSLAGVMILAIVLMLTSYVT